MISPSIGRVVWYYPPGSIDPQPWPALICYVHSDRLINLGGFKADGTTFDAREVRLVQDVSETVKLSDGFASWMPYQQKVAAEAQARIAPVIVPISKSTS